MSSQVLLALIDQGMSREEAYKKVQSLCHGLKPGEHLRHILERESLLDAKRLEPVFSGEGVRRSARSIIQRAMKGV
jgi:hypothetical protein